MLKLKKKVRLVGFRLDYLQFHSLMQEKKTDSFTAKYTTKIKLTNFS